MFSRGPGSATDERRLVTDVKRTAMSGTWPRTTRMRGTGESIFAETEGGIDEELAELGVETIATVRTYDGLLEIFCARIAGAWSMVAVWRGVEHVLFYATGPAS